MFGLRFFGTKITKKQIDEIVEAVTRSAQAGDFALAWSKAAALLRDQRDATVAHALVSLVRARALPAERCLDVLKQVFETHFDDDELMVRVGQAYESAHQVRFLNAGPPGQPFVAALGERLKALAVEHDKLPHWDALATVARLLGRAWDEVAEQAYLRCSELEPNEWGHAYALGLFYKTRGRFAEGMAANQKALKLGSGNAESVLWNLAICATGARSADVALDAQQKLGVTAKLGRFGLPEGSFGEVKVRLAQHPLAERDADHDDPGVEETIWLQRLSACHGIVRSVLVGELGINYGDAVMFDGAPITHHSVNGHEVPVFPHLATLERVGYQLFDFSGTQKKANQLAELSQQLPEDSVLYSHTEQVQMLCRACADGAGAHDHQRSEHHLVLGKLAAPPSLSPQELLAAVDAAVGGVNGVRLCIPDLCQAAGESARATVENKRAQMLRGGEPSPPGT